MARQITANVGGVVTVVTTTTLPSIGTDNFAIGGHAWLSDPVTGYFEIAMCGSGAAGGTLIYVLDNDVRVALFTGGGGQIDHAGLGAPPTSAWFGAAVRRQSGVGQVFFNGATLGGTFTGAPATPSGGVFGASVGAQGTDYRYAEGYAYTVAPTDAEMALLTAGYCPLRVRIAGLALHWHVRGIDSPELDSVGTNNGTVGANAVSVAHPTIVIPQHWAGTYARMGR